MAKQYWVGEFYVDLSRNQISQLGESQTLPPKALQVLTLLAENRGKVVSYDELMDNVWANSVVTPNTLQRCIAQLRKALGEDSKAQGIIKTHAKQGYSLECDVSWSQNTQPKVIEGTESEDPDSAVTAGEHQNKKSAKSSIQFYWMAAAAVVLAVIWFAGSQTNDPEFQFGDLRYLTATDKKEHTANYSSDGQYILFHRYFGYTLCINNIWAKNANTMEEFQLTRELGTYDGQSLSPDGKTLVFIKREDCTKPVTQNFCFKLMSMDFNAALQEPQDATELLDCQNSKISTPIWMDNQRIAMLQKEAQPWRLILFNIEDKSSKALYQFEGGNILSYDYSPSRQQFVVTSLKNDGQQYIEMLSSEGEVLSSHPIQIPTSAPRHLIARPQFVPNSDKLIFGFGSKLYSLTQNGEINHEDFRVDESVGAPHFHPEGDRLLLIKGRYDSDMARLSIQQLNEQLENGKVALSAFERSTNGEDYAKFQPNGSQLAFASSKTGTTQIWLTGESRTRMISNFARGTSINNLYWSAEGERLLVLANQELYQLSLSGEKSVYDFPYPVLEVFHWQSNEQRVMANILINGIRKFVHIDLATMEYQMINDKFVMWAVKNPAGTIVFTDHLDRFWQQVPGAIEDRLIDPLDDQGSDKRFVVSNDRIYGINKQDQLWSYDLQTDELVPLADMAVNIDYLTDTNGQELLLSFVVAAKKEVVELSVTY